jgi:hypothetical protein
MVSEPSKFSRCATPPMTLWRRCPCVRRARNASTRIEYGRTCSTQVHPRNPKSCRRLPSSGLSRPPSTLCSKAASIMSCTKRGERHSGDGAHGLLSGWPRLGSTAQRGDSRRVPARPCQHNLRFRRLGSGSGVSNTLRAPHHGQNGLKEGAQTRIVAFSRDLCTTSQTRAHRLSACCAQRVTDART